MPVSYTHLDVYKRQVLPMRRVMDFLRSVDGLVMGTIFLVAVGPVSYTHLDVYKRQA